MTTMLFIMWVDDTEVFPFLTAAFAYESFPSWHLLAV